MLCFIPLSASILLALLLSEARHSA